MQEYYFLGTAVFYIGLGIVLQLGEKVPRISLLGPDPVDHAGQIEIDPLVVHHKQVLLRNVVDERYVDEQLNYETQLDDED